MKNEFKYLSGKEISKEEAVEIAKKYARIAKNPEINVVENGDGSDYGFYSVTIKDNKTGHDASMDITKKGGHPIWFIHAREVEKQNMSLDDGSKKALEFLRENGFKDLDLYETVQYDHIGLYNFVQKQDDVRIYPDSIKIKIALDDGAILGFSSGDYLKSNHERNLPKASLTRDEARTYINSGVKIMQDGLAIIENDLKEEVLCYEFLGTLENDTYRIFINAETGHEEKVEKLQNAEPIYEDIV